jgi:preprotein translocase subunit SecG
MSLFVVACAIFLIYCYIRIYLVVQRSRKNAAGAGNQQSDREQIKKEMGLIKIMVAVTGFFLLTFLTTLVMSAADRGGTMPWMVMVIGTLALWVSPSANCIIYGWNNPHFRSAYRRLICRCCPKAGTCRVAGNQAGMSISNSEKSTRATDVTETQT